MRACVRVHARCVVGGGRDRFERFAAPPRAGKTPKGAAEPEFFSNQVPERPLHNQLVPREGRSAELLLTAKKLAEARREIGFLAQKTATLELSKFFQIIVQAKP